MGGTSTRGRFVAHLPCYQLNCSGCQPRDWWRGTCIVSRCVCAFTCTRTSLSGACIMPLRFTPRLRRTSLSAGPSILTACTPKPGPRHYTSGIFAWRKRWSASSRVLTRLGSSLKSSRLAHTRRITTRGCPSSSRQRRSMRRTHLARRRSAPCTRSRRCCLGVGWLTRQW
jgi:hypothetical protein